jgi:acyl carrier protein
MKKIVIYIFIFILLILPNFAIATSRIQTAEISKIETNLFGFDYVNDELTNRIARLENAIYGKESTGDLNTRVKKLANDIVAEQIGLEIEPTEDTFKESDLVADSTVNYPILDEIETKVFNKTFKNKDFHSRVVGIERELFGKIYDVEDYSTRMDRIKAEVVPERLAREKVFGYDNTDNAINSIDLSGLNANRFAGRMPYGQENYTRPYANYGDYFAPEDSTFDEELAQLEHNTFGTEFSNEDAQTRIKRLNSVNKAQKSFGRYDNAKFQQGMSTAMEIGAMLLMILAMVL